MVERSSTHSKTRFTIRLNLIIFKTSNLEVYIGVYYGIHKSAYNKKVAFKNEGIYTNKKDLMLAYKAFCE